MGKSLLKIGDLVQMVCSFLGITPERIEAIIHRPCGCRERQRMLNEFQDIATSLMSRKVLSVKTRVEEWVAKWSREQDHEPLESG